MKAALVLVILCLLLLPVLWAYTNQVDTIEVTAQGQLMHGAPLFLDNSPFTFTSTLNARWAVATKKNDAQADYSDLEGASSVTIAGHVYSATTPSWSVISRQAIPATGEVIYGYQFNQTATDSGGFTVQLLSGTPAVAPDLSLDSVTTRPISDFGPAARKFGMFNPRAGAGYIDGRVTDISVKRTYTHRLFWLIVVPGALVLLGVLIAVARRRS